MHFINVVCLVSLLSATNPSTAVVIPDSPLPLASNPSEFSIRADAQDVFEPVHETVYLLRDAVLSVQPSEDAGSLRSVKKYDEVLLVGVQDGAYQQVCVDDRLYYLDESCFTKDLSEIEVLKAKEQEEQKQAEERKKQEEQRVLEEQKALSEQKQQREAEAAAKAEQEAAKQAMSKNPSEIKVEESVVQQASGDSAPSISVSQPASVPAASSSGTWNGPVLTRSKGVNQGPSGKETYYNLNMSGVVRIMRSMGNQDEYWVREDGAKMLGNYVMVAANLNVHPRGSLVETSLGTGIVCDTGGFAAHNPTQLDIATAW